MMVQKAEIKIGADTRAAISEIRKLAKESKGAALDITKSFQQAEKAMKITGLAFTAAAVGGAAFLVSATKLAARVETLGVVMYQVGKVAGYTREEMAGFEKGVISQGITAQSARTSLIRLAQAEVDLADASKLARIAQDAAVIAGIDSSQAYERMIWGINTLNPRILKMMGLTISLQREYAKYAKTIGVAATALDMQTKKQIAVQAVMEAGTKILGTYEAAMETAGKKITSVVRHWEALRVSIGEEFLNMYAGLIDSTIGLLKAFNNLEPGQKRFITYLLAAGTAVAAVTGGVLLLIPAMGMLLPMIVGVGDVFLTMTAASGLATTGLWSAAAGAGALGAALTTLLVATGVGIALVGLAAAIAAIAKATKDHSEKLKEEKKRLVEIEDIARKTAKSYEDYLEIKRRLIAEDQKEVDEAELKRWQERRAEIAKNRIALLIYDADHRGHTETVRTFTGATIQQTEAQASWHGMMGKQNDRLQKAKLYVAQLATEQRDLTGAQFDAMREEEMMSAIKEEHIDLLREQAEASKDLAAVVINDMGFAYENLSLLMSGPVGKAMGDFEQGARDIRGEVRELQGQIDEWSETDYAKWLHAEDIREAKTRIWELGLEWSNLAESTDAATKSILFNMLQQELAIGGLSTVERELLLGMARDFGLVDDATYDALLAAHDWGTKWNDLAENEIAAARREARGLATDLLGIPRVIQTAIEIEVKMMKGFERAGEEWIPPTEIPAVTTTGAIKPDFEGAKGGWLSGWSLVGEKGPELISPAGYVFDALRTRMMLQGGIIPEGRFAEPEGAGYVATTPIDYGPDPWMLDPTVRATMNIPSGPGAGATSTVTAAVEAAVSEAIAITTMAVEAAVGAAVESIPTIVAAVMTTQMSMLTSQFQNQLQTAEEQLVALERIVTEIQRQGTSDDFAEAVGTEVQKVVG